MEVLVDSTFGHGMVRDRSGVAAQDKAVPTALLFTEESSRGGSRIGLRRCVKTTPEEISESSSSVGVSEESSENEEEDDAVSSQGGRCLGSFSSSLEDSLPIKRGLSNHYVGKSKSFGNLLEASNAKDLEKVESPLNKRRRLLIANKLRRRSMSLSSSSIYSKINPNSMPLLALQESDEEDHKHNNDNHNNNYDYDDDSSDDESVKLQEKRMKMTNNRDFKVQTHSCFCLTSLQDDDR